MGQFKPDLMFLIKVFLLLTLNLTLQSLFWFFVVLLYFGFFILFSI